MREGTVFDIESCSRCPHLVFPGEDVYFSWEGEIVCKSHVDAPRLVFSAC